MVSNTDKLNIVLVLIIIIIICFCLKYPFENFTSGRIKLHIYDNRLKNNFLEEAIFNNEHNLYYIASMNYYDTQHIYFMDHNLEVEKIKINDMKINDKILKLVFKIRFFQNTNTFQIGKVNIKPDGDTVPPSTVIPYLSYVNFIPYRFIPNRRMRIKRGVKYFMINYSEYMLERTGDKNFIYRHVSILNEKHKHIFFLIPYYSNTNISGLGISQGKNCIWNIFN